MPIVMCASTPAGEDAEVLVHVASPAGLIYAKAQIPFAKHPTPGPGGAVDDNGQKHLYDVFALARTFPGGAPALAAECTHVLNAEQLQHLVDTLAISFGERTDMGPVAVVAQMGLQGEAAERQLTEVHVTIGRLLGALANLGTGT